jgi:DNA repair exonuclease SbcCD ATPase subunit
LNSSQPFSDHKIRQTIEALKSDGQNITPWAVQSRLGGGDFLRIQQVIEQLANSVNQAAASNHQQSAMQFSAPTRSTPQASKNKPSMTAAIPNRPTSNTHMASAETIEILDKQMPTNIEASMYHMQTTLGQMANQLWSDAASNAENQVRGKLFSAQQAQAQAQEDNEEAQIANQKMQKKLTTLESEIEVLDVDYQQTLNALNKDRNTLAQVSEERDSLQKNVHNLEQENQQLEQKAFNSNIQAAKAEGLADIIKEQLALAKQSEKQVQKALDRSEKKVNEFNREMHNASQSLRDQMRDRQVPMNPPRSEVPSPAQLQQQYPPQELPHSAANLSPIAAETAQSAPPISAASQATGGSNANQGKSIQDLGHSLVMNRAQKVSQPKTRTLSDKLFDRKKLQSKNKNK